MNQSDAAFRILTRRHGITLTYTQMWLSDKLVEDQENQEAVLLDLKTGQDDPLARPVVCQLAGNDVETITSAALLVQPYCDAIGMSYTSGIVSCV